MWNEVEISFMCMGYKLIYFMCYMKIGYFADGSWAHIYKNNIGLGYWKNAGRFLGKNGRYHVEIDEYTYDGRVKMGDRLRNCE